MMKIFNPVWFVFVGAVLILFLAACDSKKDPNAINPDDIVPLEKMSGASDWTRFFVDLYEPMMACANNHPVKPAIIMDATPMNKGRALITVRGGDQSVFECIVTFGNSTIEDWTAIKNNQFNAPSFYPEGAGLPLPDSCRENIQLKTKDNKSVGWVSYPRSGCAG